LQSSFAKIADSENKLLKKENKHRYNGGSNGRVGALLVGNTDENGSGKQPRGGYRSYGRANKKGASTGREQNKRLDNTNDNRPRKWNHCTNNMTTRC